MSLAQSGSGSPKAPVVDSPEVLARIQAELDLVDLIARQLSRTLHRFVHFDDLLSAGREGLFLAARHFDPARGVPFRFYANLRIRAAMIEGVRRQALPRRALQALRDLESVNDEAEGFVEVRLIAADTGDQAERGLTEQIAALATTLALSRSLEDSDSADQETPEEEYARTELQQRVRESIAALEPPLGRVIQLRYLEGLELKDVARELGLERSWAGRIVIRAREELRYRLRERL